MAERCEFCRFFLNGSPRGVPAQGLCRRYPPTMHDNGQGGKYTVRVTVGGDAWCGEFQERKEDDLERKLSWALGPEWRQIVGKL